MSRTDNIKEWIGANDNQAIPARVKKRVFDRAGGKCAKCGRAIDGNKIKPIFDHIVALCNADNAHRESNLQLLCVSPCHAEKTKADVAIKKINNRINIKHLGLKTKRKIIASRGFAKSPPQRTASRPIDRRS